MAAADDRPPAFSELPHTADYALRITGADWAGLLRNAAAGLYALMAPSAPGGLRRRRQAALEAEDREGLLVAWLEELAFWAESEGFVGEDFEFRELLDTRLRAAVTGRRAGRIERLVKAVTYHDLNIVAGKDGLSATVVFDV